MEDIKKSERLIKNRLIVQGDATDLLAFFQLNATLSSEDYLSSQVLPKEIDQNPEMKRQWYLVQIGSSTPVSFRFFFSKDRNFLSALFFSKTAPPKQFIRFLSLEYPKLCFRLYWNKPYESHYELDFYSIWEAGKENPW